MAGDSVIQWFPGHMAQAMRRVGEAMRLVDIVIEVRDARIPRASANPALDELAARRKRIVALTHDDVADPAVTSRWVAYFAAREITAIAVNGKQQQSAGKIGAALRQLADPAALTRAMIVGIPNTGKSSVINALLKRSAAKAEDRAGVTRSLQWFRVAANLELMDTPGLLVPKIETPEAQWMLALCGSIPRERYDPEDVVVRFNTWASMQPSRALQRIPDLETFARTRGFLRRGEDVDMHNAARAYIKDFNDGKFGRISLEAPRETAA